MSKWFKNKRMEWLRERKRPFRRSHLMQKFDIAEAQATRDIGEFLKLHPGKWRYDLLTKQYEPIYDRGFKRNENNEGDRICN